MSDMGGKRTLSSLLQGVDMVRLRLQTLSLLTLFVGVPPDATQ